MITLKFDWQNPLNFAQPETTILHLASIVVVEKGTVKQVNLKDPVDGNVTLTAEDVGADAAGSAAAVRGDLLPRIDSIDAVVAEHAQILTAKADIVYVDAGLATKAEQASLDSTNATVAGQGDTLLTKADTAYVDAGLATKATIVDLDTVKALAETNQASVSTKAEQIDLAATNAVVAAQGDTLLTKADTAYVDAGLAGKSSSADLDSVRTLAETNQLNVSTKAEQTDLETVNATVTQHAQTLLNKADIAALTTLTQLVDTKADQAYVIDEIARITGNAPAALDTLSEIAAELGNDQTQIDNLLTQIGTRVRFDAAQSLTTAQQDQARANINAEKAGVATALVAGVTPASIGAATAAQGAKADTALQSADVAPAALSGLFSSLSGQNKIYDVVYDLYTVGTNTVITATDTLGQIINKVQGQLNAKEPTVGVGLLSQYWKGNKTWADFATDVRATALTGLVTTTNAAAVATDTVLVAVGKLQAQINTKEPTIPVGTSAQYRRGDKTWQDLGTAIRGTALTGFATVAASAVLATDTLLSAVNKLQAQVNGKEPSLVSGAITQYLRGDKTWADFSLDVRNSLLSGLSTATATAINTGDTVLVALGKAQAQLNNHNDDINSIILTGMDLISNGLGQLRSNRFWTAYIYDILDRPTGTVGSFDMIGKNNGIGDEFIAIEPGRRYLLSYQIKQKAAGVVSYCYGFLSPYDADKLEVLPRYYMAQAGTLTKLAADLKPGDTTITLQSSANWNNAAGANSHFRSLIFWNYIDGTGYKWPANTYSRNVFLNLYDDGGITGNVITLRSAWTGATIPAGTEVSNGSNGAVYMYVGAANTQVTEIWTKFSGIAGGIHPSGINAAASSSFPMMTAYVKVGFLGNRAANGALVSESKFSAGAISFKDLGYPMDSQPNSAAADVTTLKNDFNALLAKLRTNGQMLN